MRTGLLFACLCLAGLLQAQKTFIQSGSLLDVARGNVQNEKTIVVEGNRIVSILDGFQQGGQGDKVVDLRSMTVLPGLIDMHVHIEGESNPKAYLQEYTMNDADRAFDAVVYAGKTLKAGFTTVRDLGGTGVNIALRDAIAAGKVPGPRIFTSGKALGTTGGHADPTNGYRKDLMGDPGPDQGVVNGVEDARKAVRQRYKNGADLIKITATGGVLSVAKNGQNPQFTEEEIKAITSTAADYGFHVAAHAHGDEGMQRAIKGGVKTIEHGTLMSEATMKMMKEYDVYLVPTITAGKEVTENAKKKGYFPEVIAKKASEIGPMIQDTFRKAYEMGVPIAFGTDAGVFPHGENAREFKYMAEAGMPVAEALRIATMVNADLLGMKDQLGQLKEGFLADIIAVPGNPMEQVDLLSDVRFVMKDGAVVKTP